MRKIVLISCVSKKQPVRCRAREMYISPLFTKYLDYARNLAPEAIFILSAKYGLIGLDDVIEPYDLTLNVMPAPEIKQWANAVLHQLAGTADLLNDCFVLLAGVKYRKYLVPHLRHVEVPFKGLAIGRQLHELNA